MLMQAPVAVVAAPSMLAAAPALAAGAGSAASIEAALAMGLMDDFAILGPAVSEMGAVGKAVSAGQLAGKYDRLRRAAENIFGNDLNDLAVFEETGITPADIFSPRMEATIRSSFHDPEVVEAQLAQLKRVRSGLHELGINGGTDIESFRKAVNGKLAESAEHLRSALPEASLEEREKLWNALDPDHRFRESESAAAELPLEMANAAPGSAVHWQITQQTKPDALPARFAFFNPRSPIEEEAVKKFLVHFTQNPVGMLKELQCERQGERLIVTTQDRALLTSLQYQSLNAPGRA